MDIVKNQHQGEGPAKPGFWIMLDPSEYFTVKLRALQFHVKRIGVYTNDASFHLYGAQLRAARLWSDDGALDRLDHRYESPRDIIMPDDIANVIYRYRDLVARSSGTVNPAQIDEFCASTTGA